MSRLCMQMSPFFTEKNLQMLHQRKIFTVLDFLQEDLEFLAQFLKQPFKELLQVRSNLLITYSAFPRQALNVYNDLVVNSALIPTGVEGLDTLLDGGFLTGNVYEVYGFSGVGKTQLCHSVAVNVTKDLKQQVLVVDSCLSFCARRLRSMLQARSCSHQEIKILMNRIKVTRVEDVYEALSLLQKFKESLHREPDENSAVRLIILDSLPPLFFTFLGDNLSDGLGLMNHFASLVKFVANEYHVAFVLVNISTRIHDGEPLTFDLKDLPPSGEPPKSTEKVRPALGKYWSHVPSTRLLLQKSVCGSEITMKSLVTVVDCADNFTFVVEGEDRNYRWSDPRVTCALPVTII